MVEDKWYGGAQEVVSSIVEAVDKEQEVNVEEMSGLVVGLFLPAVRGSRMLL